MIATDYSNLFIVMTFVLENPVSIQLLIKLCFHLSTIFSSLAQGWKERFSVNISITFAFAIFYHTFSLHFNFVNTLSRFFWEFCHVRNYGNENEGRCCGKRNSLAGSTLQCRCSGCLCKVPWCNGYHIRRSL